MQVPLLSIDIFRYIKKRQLSVLLLLELSKTLYEGVVQDICGFFQLLEALFKDHNSRFIFRLESKIHTGLVRVRA